MDSPLKATTGRATEAQAALMSCCQKGWHSNRRCQARDQGGCREELPPPARSCGEGDATASLSGLSLLTYRPQILSCLLTPTLTSAPGLPPLHLYCVNTPNSAAELKWVAVLAVLLLGVNLLLLPCTLRCSIILTAAALVRSLTERSILISYHPQEVP